MNIANIVALYLIDKGIGTAGTTVFANFLPETTTTCVCVYPTGGFNVSPTEGYDEPTVQCLFRATTPDAAIAMAENVYNQLQALHNATLPNSTHVVFCRALQTAPETLGRDAQERFEYTQNYHLRIRNKTLYRK